MNGIPRQWHWVPSDYDKDKSGVYFGRQAWREYAPDEALAPIPEAERGADELGEEAKEKK